jgi:hypothetical protein
MAIFSSFPSSFVVVVVVQSHTVLFSLGSVRFQIANRLSSNAGAVGSIPHRGLDAMLSCVCTGLTTSRSPVQDVLPNV